MILYRLGLSSDAFSISVFEVAISIVIFAILVILAIFTIANVSEEAYPTNAIEEFLQDHKLITFIITFSLSFLAAGTMYLVTEMIVVTAPNTIVESRYILNNSTRKVEVKDDFKTVYTNEENVEFSSILEESTFDNLPQDLLHDLRSKGISRSRWYATKDSGDFKIFSTNAELNLQQVKAMRSLSEYKHVIAINASKSDSSVKILATVDSVELTKEEENEENMTYRIDKIEMANAVETISRDSQSKSRDIKSVKLHISGKTSESAKARKSIEKLVE